LAIEIGRNFVMGKKSSVAEERSMMEGKDQSTRRIPCSSEKRGSGLFSPFIRILSLLIGAAMFMSGCSTTKDIKLTAVQLCENQQCSPIMPEALSKEELLLKMFELLNESRNIDIPLFTSNPEKRTPEKPAVRFYIQGGFIPAFCHFKSVKITDVLPMNRENLEVKFKVVPKATYVGIPVVFAGGEGTLAIKSLTEIRVAFKNIGTWLVVGTSVWKTEWLIDYIDLNRKVLGAHYSIAGGGPMCVGGGSGYQLAYFAGKEARSTTLETLPMAFPPAKNQRLAEYLGRR
jgi:hypothetical protein